MAGRNYKHLLLMKWTFSGAGAKDKTKFKNAFVFNEESLPKYLNDCQEG